MNSDRLSLSLSFSPENNQQLVNLPIFSKEKGQAVNKKRLKRVINFTQGQY